ncbi:ABC transporter permease [Brevibacillus daliensis]|uniref:ABC transporter permease n=1 Tax=Brevibacillus daliensis TaxID=2892995 RepID=UPI001E33FA08|nr:ABC transporter permease [Brevibacillus daliensis]
MEQHQIEHIFLLHKQEEKRKARLVFLCQIGLLAIFIALWETAARLQWVDVLLFSSPSRIWVMFLEKLSDLSLFTHTGITVMETVVGFLLGTIFGTLIATAIWWSPFLSRVLEPYLIIANSMPKVALGPLFIVGLGPGIISIIATTLSVSIIITTLVIYSSFREVNPQYTKVMQTFGATKQQIFRKVILPATTPTIVSTLKVNVGLSWVGVIVGEFLVAQKGLGYLIIYGFQVFNFTLVLMSLFVIAIVAAVMYQGVSYLEKRLTSQFK